MKCDLCGREVETFDFARVVTGDLTSVKQRSSGNVITTTKKYENFKQKEICFCEDCWRFEFDRANLSNGNLKLYFFYLFLVPLIFIAVSSIESLFLLILGAAFFTYYFITHKDLISPKKYEFKAMEYGGHFSAFFDLIHYMVQGRYFWSESEWLKWMKKNENNVIANNSTPPVLNIKLTKVTGLENRIERLLKKGDLYLGLRLAAVKAKLDVPETYYVFGKTLEKLGRQLDAYIAYKIALTAAPYFPEASENANRLRYYNLECDNVVIKVDNAYLEKYQLKKVKLIAKIEKLLSKGKAKKAAKYAHFITATHDADGIYLYARAMEALNRKDEANSCYQKINAINSSFFKSGNDKNPTAPNIGTNMGGGNNIGS